MGAVVDVTKLDASEIKGDIFIRDAIVAETEVSRITGDAVGDELEEDEDLTGSSSFNEMEKKKLNNVPQAVAKETVKLEEPKEGEEDAPKKAGGWFRAKTAVKGGAFQKGRVGGADGNSLKNRKQNVAAANNKGKGEDIGTISLARGKK